MTRFLAILSFLTIPIASGLAKSSAPANDNYANATLLTVNVPTAGTLVGATREPGDPDHSGNGYRNVWYEFIPSSTGIAHVSVIADGSFSGLSITSISGNPLPELLTSDGINSYVYVVKGYPYFICYEGYDTQKFTIAVSVDASLPQVNNFDNFAFASESDNFAAPFSIGSESSLILYTHTATFEPFEQTMLDTAGASYGGGGTGGVWVLWTAPATGTAYVGAKTIFSKKVVLLAAPWTYPESIPSLTLIGAGYNGMTFPCTANALYYLYVLDQQDDSAFLSISVSPGSGGTGGSQIPGQAVSGRFTGGSRLKSGATIHAIFSHPERLKNVTVYSNPKGKVRVANLHFNSNGQITFKLYKKKKFARPFHASISLRVYGYSGLPLGYITKKFLIR